MHGVYPAMSNRYLLDTHALLWWLFDDPKLSNVAKDIIKDRSNDIQVSSASAWEISTKYRIGKLPSASQLIKDLPGYITKAGFEQLSITVQHAQLAGSYESSHRDPFDRMLAAQASLESMTLITCDRALQKFDVRCVW